MISLKEGRDPKV